MSSDSGVGEGDHDDDDDVVLGGATAAEATPGVEALNLGADLDTVEQCPVTSCSRTTQG